MRQTKNHSYKECATCKTLGDCPHPDVALDMMGSPLPPECCYKPIEIMTNTLKAKKIRFADYLRKEEEEDEE